jgi:hypothetical protein
VTDETPTLWAIYVQGPDDLIAEPSERAAVIHAGILNEHFAATGNYNPTDPFEPTLRATPTVWTSSPEAHAANLAEQAADDKEWRATARVVDPVMGMRSRLFSAHRFWEGRYEASGESVEDRNGAAMMASAYSYTLCAALHLVAEKAPEVAAEVALAIRSLLDDGDVEDMNADVRATSTWPKVEATS